jgi:hypothetical protein
LAGENKAKEVELNSERKGHLDFQQPFYFLLGAFIIQGKLLMVRQNLESKLKETLKSFSEVGNEIFLSNNTKIMWRE